MSRLKKTFLFTRRFFTKLVFSVLSKLKCLCVCFDWSLTAGVNRSKLCLSLGVVLCPLCLYSSVVLRLHCSCVNTHRAQERPIPYSCRCRHVLLLFAGMRTHAVVVIFCPGCGKYSLRMTPGFCFETLAAGMWPDF